MSQTNSRFYSLMVVGENPKEMVAKYGSDFKQEPYIKYKYVDASKYRATSIKAIKSLLEKFDKTGLQPQTKQALKNRLEILEKLSSFDYYRELTEGMHYDENGNALTDENPNAKFNTCRIGRNFCIPLKLKNGEEAQSARMKDIDWDAMNGVNKAVYSAAWELVVDKRDPSNEQEKQILDAMQDKEAYFANFKSKDAYVTYNTAYWNYAYLDENGWIDVDDSTDEVTWVKEFYPRFVEKLDPNALITIFECSVNDG